MVYHANFASLCLMIASHFMKAGTRPVMHVDISARNYSMAE